MTRDTPACIGEGMVELGGEADGRFARGFGGDTLNIAIYLARLGVSVEYATTLGDDPWSQEMKDGWAAEGIGDELVIHCAGAMPGLYVIQTDDRGERGFLHWRDSAAARRQFGGAELLLNQKELAGQVRMPDAEPVLVPTRPSARVVDTTAAGDSFAAAYLAARIRGKSPAAAEAAHRLAGTVVTYPGAIIPPAAMPVTA